MDGEKNDEIVGCNLNCSVELSQGDMIEVNELTALDVSTLYLVTRSDSHE